MIGERPELKDRVQVFGTWGAEIVGELKPQQGDIVIQKQKHSGFIGTNLDFILRSYDIRYLLFLGIASNICVQATLSHAFSLGYFPLLISDAVSQMGPAYTQEATIFNVKATFGWVTTSENFVKALEAYK
jgi:ureidoacrylate peracid hydrolase